LLWENPASLYIISSCSYFYGMHPRREMTNGVVYFSSFMLDRLLVHLYNLGASFGEHYCGRPIQHGEYHAWFQVPAVM
jgi:hypothetical protein